MSEKEKEKEERLRAAIKRRVEKEERAFRIVEKMVLNDLVDREFLISAGMFITVSQYKDVVEERGITRLCGYPLCKNRLTQVLKQKYKISLKEKKVYDITERKNFCSNICYRKSKYYESQLLAEPVWMRDKMPLEKLKLLEESNDPRQSTNNGLSGFGEEIFINTKTGLHSSSDKVVDKFRPRLKDSSKESVNRQPLISDEDEGSDYDSWNEHDKDYVGSSCPGLNDVGIDDDDSDGARSIYNKREDDISYECKRLENVHVNNEAKNDNYQRVCDDNDDEIYDDSDDLDDRNDDDDVADDDYDGDNVKNRKAFHHRDHLGRETSLTSRSSRKSETSKRSKMDKGRHQKPIKLSTKDSEANVSNRANSTSKQHPEDSLRINNREWEVRYVSNSWNRSRGDFSGNKKHENDGQQRVGPKSKDKTEIFQSADESNLKRNLMNETDSNVKLDNMDSYASSRSLDRNNVGNSEEELKRKRCVENVLRTLREWCSAETRNYCTRSHNLEVLMYESGCPEFHEEGENTLMRLGYSDQVSEECDSDDDLHDKTEKQTDMVNVAKDIQKARHEVSGKTIKAKTNVYIPSIDSKSQMTIRGKIASEKLTMALSPALSRLGLTLVDVSSGVTNILKTFRFTNTNIVLKPSEWTLVGLTVILILTKFDTTLKALLSSRQKDLHALLNDMAVNDDDLDGLVNVFFHEENPSAILDTKSDSYHREFNMEELD